MIGMFKLGDKTIDADCVIMPCSSSAYGNPLAPVPSGRNFRMEYILVYPGWNEFPRFCTSEEAVLFADSGGLKSFAIDFEASIYRILHYGSIEKIW